MSQCAPACYLRLLQVTHKSNWSLARGWPRKNPREMILLINHNKKAVGRLSGCEIISNTDQDEELEKPHNAVIGAFLAVCPEEARPERSPPVRFPWSRPWEGMYPYRSCDGSRGPAEPLKSWHKSCFPQFNNILSQTDSPTHPVLLNLLIAQEIYIPSGEGNDYPLQYSRPENPMDGGAWWATVHGVAKSQTQLTDWRFHFSHSFHRNRFWKSFQKFSQRKEQKEGKHDPESENKSGSHRTRIHTHHTTCNYRKTKLLGPRWEDQTNAASVQWGGGPNQLRERQVCAQKEHVLLVLGKNRPQSWRLPPSWLGPALVTLPREPPMQWAPALWQRRLRSNTHCL